MQVLDDFDSLMRWTMSCNVAGKTFNIDRKAFKRIIIMSFFFFTLSCDVDAILIIMNTKRK